MTFSLFEDHKSRWYLIGLLSLATLIFAKTLFFDFVWDDHVFLVGQVSYESATLNKLLLSPLNGVEYLPLRDLSYIIDYYVWGWKPFGFHLSNLVIYCLNIWAVYWLTVVLNSTLLPLRANGKSDDAVWTALVTAAFFTVLPLHSEAVSFIHARNVLLSGLFFFLSCIYFLKFIDQKLWRHVITSFALFALALLSKATVIILPLILAMFLYLKPVQKLKDYVSVLLFIPLAIIFFFVFKYQATESQFINNDLVMGLGNNSLVSRLAVAVQIPFFYVAKLLAPVGLSTEYKIQFSREIFSPVVIFAGLVLVLFLSLAYYFRRKYPQVLFALLWFLICLIPVSNFFLTNPVVADRYAYLSSFAYAYILAIGAFQIRRKVGPSRSLIILLPVLGIYAWMTFERNDVWLTNVSVMEDMTKPHSNQAKGYNNLGQEYFRQGQYQKAIEYFQKAKEISPGFSRLEFHQAKLAFQQNRPAEALELLDAATRFNENETFDALNLRALIYESQGDLVKAAKSYRKSANSTHTTSFTRQQAEDNLERVMSELEPSLNAVRKDVLDHPGDLNKKANFAIVLQNVGLNQEAISQYNELISLGGPKWEVYANLGKIYWDEGQLDQAINNYRMSLSLNDTSAKIHNELGIVYIQAGRFEEALGQFQTTVRLDPGSANALVNLGRLHFLLGNEQLAREAFNRVLVQFPDYEAVAREYLIKLSR